MSSLRKKANLVSRLILGSNTSGENPALIAFSTENIVEVHRYRSGITVWAQIISNDRTDLVILETWAVTAKR